MPRRILYQPGSARPFRLSRSKVELFLSCPRCFYLDRRLGISRPASFPFNLNSAVDTLLKAEFDQYREAREPHPYMTEAGLDAIPFDEMWEDDRYWLPLVIDGKRFSGSWIFDGDRMLDYRLEVLG